MNDVKIPRKLIETALPLDAINVAGGYEKLVKVGKPTVYVPFVSDDTFIP